MLAKRLMMFSQKQFKEWRINMRKISYVEAIKEALREEMLRDERVFIMGEDVTVLGGPYKTCANLYKEFEGRVKNTPISEAAIAGAALGAAVTGMRPVAELMYVDFFGCAMDQIANQIAKMRYMFGGKAKVPLVIKSQQGGYVQNAAQHSQSLEAWIMHIPGLKLVMPSCAADAKGLMKTAIRDDNPVVFLDHKIIYEMKDEVPEHDYTIPFGKADIKREGNDVTVIATSYMVIKALNVAKALGKEGIDVEVVDPRTLVPLDKETIINSVKKTGKIVIVHEACLTCGIGAEIAAIISKEAFDYLEAPIERVAAKNAPIPYSAVLENTVLPQEEDIVSAIKALINY